eukprot:3883375-Pyramimonas_sp.AAC.1
MPVPFEATAQDLQRGPPLRINNAHQPARESGKRMPERSAGQLKLRPRFERTNAATLTLARPASPGGDGEESILHPGAPAALDCPPLFPRVKKPASCASR